ncbi:MAG: AAA family ATPase [Patescibacteria group bacterium]
MRLEKITINRYKSIKKLVLHDLGILHIFIGANNAGKTNILDSIYRLYNGNSIRLHDPECDIHASFSLTLDRKKSILDVVQLADLTKFLLDDKEISPDKGKEILSSRMVRICATDHLSIQKVQHDFESLVVQYPDQFELFHRTLQQYIPQIMIDRKLFTSSTIEHEGATRPYERLGAGFRQVFKILLYLFHPVYSVLLLEEPEVHLHPALIKKLISILEERNLDNQIFLTTHSTNFVRPENLHRIFRVTKEGDTTKVHSPRLTGKRINYERLRQELNADNTEMFFADKVLLVEGPSDHILMRELINKFYTGTKDIKVIQVYGKSNIDVYTDVLDLFDLPYCVLLDRDALYDTGLNIIQKKIQMRFTEPEVSLIEMLKKYSVFILPNGSIENNYPRKYQHRQKHKTQNAMYAASRITQDEFVSPRMKFLKEVIDNL